MADIRNDQYLHRPTAGRGAITPADPLEVLLHSGGQPISGTNRLPVEATLSGRIDVLYDDQPPEVTAGSLITVISRHPTIYKEVRVGLALHSGIVGKWRVTVRHLHRRSGNVFRTDNVIDISDELGGAGSVSLMGSFFEVRIHNDNDFDGRPWAFVVLGVR